MFLDFFLALLALEHCGLALEEWPKVGLSSIFIDVHKLEKQYHPLNAL